jgi:hypothetical protein
MTARARTLAALVLTGALALTGCSEDDAQDAADQARESASQAAEDAREQLEDAELPEVDWDQYGEEVKERLDTLADQADCDSLEEELAQAEADDSDLTEYIKAKIREACS